DLPAGEQRGRLLKEAQALARLSHPHVVRVYEAREVGDQVFVVMELVEGHTLGEWLREVRSWREVLEVFVKAGGGLQAAHRAGQVPPAPRGSHVPRWVRRSLLRGLCVPPGDRFPSMGELLSALAKNPLQRYRAPLAVAASVLLVASGAALGAFRTGPGELLCS